ncbi:MAG: hypothetical protein D6717_00820 [Gammaproteobacteria bacterium]|nr:MAG: hypothetical protein D6717_00820 [Gammaproteobacteria bacterium]
MMRRLLFISLLGWLGMAKAQQHWVVDSEDWDRPRSAEHVLSLAPVRQAVHGLLLLPDSRLEIRYPGGEAGSLQAAELRDWLISLGIDADRLETVPAPLPGGQLELQLFSAEGS